MRKVADIPMGFFTFRERWERISGIRCRYESEGLETASAGSDLSLPENALPDFNEFDLSIPVNEYLGKYTLIEKPWQIFQLNQKAILFDYRLATSQRISAELPSHVKSIGSFPVFIEEGAMLEHCFINSKDGPVFISQDALIMDGAMLRGPLFIGRKTVVKAGTSIYGATSIGHNCVVGGEIKNVVMMANSNKAHHGYLGDSVVGEWCNLGAGTTSSNMKNTAGQVKLWSMYKKDFEFAGNKCGLIMGDFSRAAINTSFNTGTVTGICSNIFDGQELTPKFIPSFSWGKDGKIKYDFEKVVIEINSWMAFKGQSLTKEMIETLTNIYQKQ
ncbi:glucose-1-phosphate thymidylyltransferase [Pollutibacter soli]|uniref:glucose-1-phosphate thymidylyltransferase n=1 Tax=Pollutibacter soli TaxID=3034157 RepID=UPI003013C215